ncbi:MAG: TA system VapC family ribonuclease toxin [Verrucomicrobiota bacterium]
MIAVDTNILVYAHREDSPWHEEALAKLTELANSGQHWAITWSTYHEFIAIVTHPKIYQPPTPLTTALKAMAAWQSSPGLRMINEGPGYLETFSQLSKAAKIKGPKTHDARIAAICLHHKVKTLWTADHDFSAFPKLNCENPLIT